MKKLSVLFISITLFLSLAFCIKLSNDASVVNASEAVDVNTEFFLPSSPLEFYELISPVAIYSSSDGYMAISEFYKDEENANNNFNRISVYDPNTEKYTVIKGKGVLNGENTIFGITQITKYGDYLFYLSGNDVYYIPVNNLQASPKKTGVIASNFFSINDDILIANTSNGIKSYTVNLSGETPIFTQTGIEIEVEMTTCGFLSKDKDIYYYADPCLYRYSTKNSTSYLVAEIKNINYCVEIGDYVYFTAMGEGLLKVKKDGLSDPELIIPADKNATGLGAFNTPQGLTVKDGKLLVCDAILNTIQEVDPATDKFTNFAITTESTADFRLTNNASNTFLSENYIYAVDNSTMPITNEVTKKRIVKISLNELDPTPYKKIDLSSIYEKNEAFEIKLITGSDTHILIYDGEYLTLYEQVLGDNITLKEVKAIQNSSVTALCYLEDSFYFTDTANNLNYNYINVYKWTVPSENNMLYEVEEETLIEENTEIKGVAKNITVDVFGNVYIYYTQDNGVNYLTRLYNNNITNPITINYNVKSINTDFNGNVYALSSSNKIYKYTLKNNAHVVKEFQLKTSNNNIVKDMSLNYSSEVCYFLSNACIYKNSDNALDVKSLSKISAKNVNTTEILNDVKFISINENAKLFKVVLGDYVTQDNDVYFKHITPISNLNTSKVYAVIADLSDEYYLVSYSSKTVALVRKSSINNDFSQKADATIIDSSHYSEYGISITDDNYKSFIISNDASVFSKPIFDENYKINSLKKGEEVYAIKTIKFNGKSITLIAKEPNKSPIGYVVSGYLIDEIIVPPTLNEPTQTVIGGGAEKRIVTTLMILLISFTITFALIVIENKLLFKKD